MKMKLVGDSVVDPDFDVGAEGESRSNATRIQERRRVSFLSPGFLRVD